MVDIPKRNFSDGYFYYHTKDKRKDAVDIGHFLLDEGADIYADGSCYDGTRRTAHAGLAIVQFIEGFWKVIAYALPDYLDQSAAYAEATALLLSIRHMKQGGSYTLVTDCAAVIRGWAKLQANKPLSPNAINAGIWRQIRDEAARKQVKIQLRKVKAHRTKEEVPEDELKDWTGNDKADENAKFAAKAFKWEDSILEDEVNKNLVEQILMQHGLERARYAYEKGGDFIRRRPRSVKNEEDEESEEDFTINDWAGQHGGHWLHYAREEGRVKCGACGLTFSCLKKATKTACKGGRTALLKACEAQQAKGHALYACTADQDEVIVFCARCGYYANKQCIKLNMHCEGSAARTKHRKRTIENILKGRHPEPHKGHVGVGPVWRIARPCVAEAVPKTTETRHMINEVVPEEEDEEDSLANEVKRIGEMEAVLAEAEAAAEQEATACHEEDEEAMSWALATWGRDDQPASGEEVVPTAPKKRRIRGKSTDFRGAFSVCSSVSRLPPACEEVVTSPV